MHSLFSERMPACMQCREDTRGAPAPYVCVAPPCTEIKPLDAPMNRSCVLMLSGDFLWYSLHILQPGIKPDQGALSVKHVRSLARRLSHRELCQKHIVLLQKKKKEKKKCNKECNTGHTVEMHRVWWETPGVAPAPSRADKTNSRAGGQQVDVNAFQEWS